MWNSKPILRFLIAGRFSQDTILLPNGASLIDIPGGSALYAAAGLAIWEKGIGLLGRVGENYPLEWLEKITKIGFDKRGVQIPPVSIDLRNFYAYPDLDTRETNNTVSHFARMGLKFPKSLLGYNSHINSIDSQNRSAITTLLIKDIPEDYYDANALHICPMDYLSHQQLSYLLNCGNISTITIDPNTEYMTPLFWEEVHSLIKGFTAFLSSEEKLLALYCGRSNDLWEMAEELTDHRCDMLVIKRGARGQYLYVPANHSRWMIPAYPVSVVDPTGAGDAFCGGFLAGYHRIYDPLESVLYGNISASFTVEGSGPFYTSDTLPKLADARLENLREMIRRI